MATYPPRRLLGARPLPSDPRRDPRRCDFALGGGRRWRARLAGRTERFGGRQAVATPAGRELRPGVRARPRVQGRGVVRQRGSAHLGTRSVFVFVFLSDTPPPSTSCGLSPGWAVTTCLRRDCGAPLLPPPRSLRCALRTAPSPPEEKIQEGWRQTIWLFPQQFLPAFLLSLPLKLTSTAIRDVNSFWALWCKHLISAPRRQRPVNLCRFQAIQSYTVRPCLKKIRIKEDVRSRHSAPVDMPACCLPPAIRTPALCNRKPKRFYHRNSKVIN
ncbi:uncharacterized protein LOC103163686 isoform X2 [Cricetulus griseus]|uniref:Uncharacterized protein LOC103163686 isoform X2 n=1 Tax=Cricetulus griseus TaxID=10029 RepID=A0A9J7KED3_CRIGR|nr:uncharacterized protein LOC103163686 isoform X2 [Cricetulus griseus]